MGGPGSRQQSLGRHKYGATRNADSIRPSTLIVPEQTGHDPRQSPDVENSLNAGSGRITRNPESTPYRPELAPAHLI